MSCIQSLLLMRNYQLKYHSHLKHFLIWYKINYTFWKDHTLLNCTIIYFGKTTHSSNVQLYILERPHIPQMHNSSGLISASVVQQNKMKTIINRNLSNFNHFRIIKYCSLKSYHHHQISVMELGHLLTRSSLMYPEVSSKVCHDSFCQLGSSVSLPWVIYYRAL